MTEIIKNDAYQTYCDAEKENAEHLTDGFVRLLELRHEAKLSWVEPWPAKSPDGSNIDAHVEMAATVHDCINLQRVRWDGIRDHFLKDKELLIDFMAVNWAKVNLPNL